MKAPLDDLDCARCRVDYGHMSVWTERNLQTYRSIVCKDEDCIDCTKTKEEIIDCCRGLFGEGIE